FPFAADDHQTANAEVMVKANAAMLIKDSELTGEKLVSNIKDLSDNKNLLERMGANAKSMAKPNAAADIVDELLKLAGEAA
ncbi:UDP-N-acetylglucosamine--N-acetylmuramyl-(pentapeptide) pyrophosphoryl-undecaprenol N-acetylglucosamine transferase, partial [hydrothermal vent metagenome]